LNVDEGTAQLWQTITSCTHTAGMNLRAEWRAAYGFSLMFAAPRHLIMASMSQIDPGADTPLVNWSDLGVSELMPTGTVTLLLADIEGSTRLWEAQPDEMTAALALLDRALADMVAARGGVRPVEQGEGDSFVIAFARASDAVACALDLQRAPLAPIRLRIGVHTGEVQLRDEGNYVGPTINRTARLRDLAHGGQTVLSGATEAMVVEGLPADAWLMDLGTHQLRDLSRPERVVQLCHPDVRNEFPPLRTAKSLAPHNLPAQLTSFVGRGPQVEEVRQILGDNRLVTLTGAGGVGKTRLAVRVAGRLGDYQGDDVWFVDFAPIADPDIVAIAAARALGLPDQPGRSTVDTLLGFIGGRHMLVVLDNCEHLLDATASLVIALLGACPALTLLVTSREPIGVAGEVTWQVPSLSLADEAIELFVDRARLVRPDFHITDETSAAVAEICRRLDGMPLAIELAAARVRALSVEEIRDSLHDRFRLLTGGARKAVRRQQTLRASVDWSYALLTEPERVLFRRLAVFTGGCDLAAARAVAGDRDVERYQVLDQLTLLVDKSLVVAGDVDGRTRYRLLETVRQYALEKLSESGEADDVRTRHRDYYESIADQLDRPAGAGRQQRIEQAQTEIDNLRAAFAWSHENADFARALALASSLQPLWLGRSGRILEGLAWFDTVLFEHSSHQSGVAPAVRARALADRALLHASGIGTDSTDQAEQALALAREVGEPAPLARALTACGAAAANRGEAPTSYFAEAIDLSRTLGDRWTLSQILGWQAQFAWNVGDPLAARTAGEEGYDVANALGDPYTSYQCRTWIGWAQMITGDLAGALAQFREVGTEAEAGHDPLWWMASTILEGQVLTHRGDTSAAGAVVDAAMAIAAEVGELHLGMANGLRAITALAAGDVAAADEASEIAQQLIGTPAWQRLFLAYLRAELALARGNVTGARRWADEAVSVTTGWWLVVALTTRARVATAQGEPQHAERDAHDALAHAVGINAQLGVPDILELLATLAVDAGDYRQAVRQFGAAEAIRQRIGVVRFKIHHADYDASVARARDALGGSDFDAARAEGAALSTEEAIAYAQRGRGKRKRPTKGWGSLTPTERDVVRLVGEGLANKDVATRLFISARTVETHLTHVYTKLGLASRVQLVQEAARHT
jgi:predicted ATPase/class 3 adenylate cyclase/DNA-binding CsgD family transcriptional regulator